MEFYQNAKTPSPHRGQIHTVIIFTDPDCEKTMSFSLPLFLVHIYSWEKWHGRLMLKRYYVLKPSANPLFLGNAGNICSLFCLFLYVIIISLVYNTITLKGETLCAILEISDDHCAGRSQTEIIPPPVLIPILSFLPASPSQPGCLSAGPGCCNRPLIPRIHIFIYTTVIPEKVASNLHWRWFSAPSSLLALGKSFSTGNHEQSYFRQKSSKSPSFFLI